MLAEEIQDPGFRAAVSALDAGDLAGLERLLASEPRLVHDRIEQGEGYFIRPYLLWFVAENPIRTGRLPDNILEMTRAIIAAGSRGAEQLDYTVELVASGRIVREHGVQLALIDLLMKEGARPRGLMMAIAHREMAAAERLVEHGAEVGLAAALALGRAADPTSAPIEERQLALAAAAFLGKSEVVRSLIDTGVDVNAFCPEGFHPHSTPLHQAVACGSLDTVRVLVDAGARLDVRDRGYQGTPLEWAEHVGHEEIARFLAGRSPPP